LPDRSDHPATANAQAILEFENEQVQRQIHRGLR
jgi:hypothetical protein